MDTIFMNTKNSKISDPHKLLFKGAATDMRYFAGSEFFRS